MADLVNDRIHNDKQFLTNGIFINSDTEARFIIDRSWKENESIWQGKLPYDTTAPIDESGLRYEIRTYFNNKCYNIDPSDIPSDQENYNVPLEVISKMCWLSDVWLSTGFDNAIGCHWNPRIGKNVVHPGYTRKKVIDLFPPKTRMIDVIYFNTGGIQAEWMRNLTKVDFEELMNDNWMLPVFVPDHGSMIPHIQKDIEYIPFGIKDYHGKIFNRLRSLRLSSNVPIKYLEPWLVTRNHTVEVTCDTKLDVVNHARVIVSVLSGNDIDINGIKVTHKENL